MLYAVVVLLLKVLLGFGALILLGIGLMWLGFSVVHNWQGGRRG